jgi:hypothetical protein
MNGDDAKKKKKKKRTKKNKKKEIIFEKTLFYECVWFRKLKIKSAQYEKLNSKRCRSFEKLYIQNFEV